MKLSKAQRDVLRLRFGGRCAYCGCELPENGWHADHMEPVWRYRKVSYEPVPENPIPADYFNRKRSEKNVMAAPEWDTLDNLVPSCAKCNNYKMANDVETFRRQVSRQVEMLRKYSPNFRTAERFGLVKEIKKPVVFWFESLAAQGEQHD